MTRREPTAVADAVDVGAAILLWLFDHLDALPTLGLDAEDFGASPPQAIVYGWLAELHADGATLAGAVEAWDRAQERGGDVAEAMIDVLDKVHADSLPLSDRSSVERIAAQARVLRRARVRRDTRREAERLLAVSAGDPEAFARQAERAAVRVREMLGATNDVAPDDPLAIVRDSYHAGAYLNLGFERIMRDMDGGLPRGDLLCINACPSVGKTALLGSMNEAVLEAHPDGEVVFFSLEMSKPQLFRRHLMSFCRATKEELEAAMTRGAPWPTARRPEDFRRLAARYTIVRSARTTQRMAEFLSGRGRVSIVAVDYLQRMIRPRAESTVAAIEQNMHDLKTIAQTFDCGVVVLSQIPREKGEPWDPVTLRSGKGSSAIEEVPDYLWGLWRPNFKIEQRDRVEVAALRVGLLKCRHGFVGRYDLPYDLVRQRVTDKLEPAPRRDSSALPLG